MSIREMQNLISQTGMFTFIDGNTDEGMIVSRYNIPEAKIEYYFIPSKNVIAYQSARSHHELDAHRKLGRPVNESTILMAHLTN
ncbi:MAG TPA: hypothetical protein PLU53_12605 [Bacteroidia bacterium]|nr:hypothetical protein [Bacteroidia bacterium]